MARKANLVIDQGSDFEAAINITDDDDQLVDLTGYTGAAAMKKHYTSSNSHSFDVNVATSGTVTLTMNAAATSAIAAGRYVYDCKLTSSANVVSRIIEGIVKVTPKVT